MTNEQSEVGSGQRGRNAVMAGIAVACLFLGGWALLPKLTICRENARRTSCARNLSQIGMARFMYAEAHDGRFPERLSGLYPASVADVRTFQCPFRKRTVLSPQQIDAESDYVLVPRRTVESVVEIVVYCRHPHPDGTANVLVGVGSVEYMSQEELQALLKSAAKEP